MIEKIRMISRRTIVAIVVTLSKGVRQVLRLVEKSLIGLVKGSKTLAKKVVPKNPLD